MTKKNFLIIAIIVIVVLLVIKFMGSSDQPATIDATQNTEQSQDSNAVSGDEPQDEDSTVAPDDNSQDQDTTPEEKTQTN